MTRQQAGRPRCSGANIGSVGGFCISSKTSRSAPALTQPVIQWVAGGCSPGAKAAGGVKLTIHLHMFSLFFIRSTIKWLVVRLALHVECTGEMSTVQKT